MNPHPTRRLSIGLLALLLALPAARAATKAELRRRFPTLEAAAHGFGALDVGHTLDHHLLVHASYGAVPGQFSGYLRTMAAVRGEVPYQISLLYIHTRQGYTLDRLENRFRPDLHVDRDGGVDVQFDGQRYPGGTVGLDLKVTMNPELWRHFSGQYVYIPALDGVYESPWELPRRAYFDVAARRYLSRDGTARFATTTGAGVRAELSVLPQFESDERFLAVTVRGRRILLGEMLPFGDPGAWGKERDLYSSRRAGLSRVPIALFNEIGHPEEAEPTSVPDGITVVYGVKIYDRYLAGFDPDRGPILRNLDGSPERAGADKAAPGGGGAGSVGTPEPGASASPGPVPASSAPGEPEEPGSPGD